MKKLILFFSGILFSCEPYHQGEIRGYYYDVKTTCIKSHEESYLSYEMTRMDIQTSQAIYDFVPRTRDICDEYRLDTVFTKKNKVI